MEMMIQLEDCLNYGHGGLSRDLDEIIEVCSVDEVSQIGRAHV